jgi:hypothetical protein
LIFGAWEQELENDIDKYFLLDGIKNGFKIRNIDQDPVAVEKENYNSATCPENRNLVEKQILTEIEEGRYIVTQDKPIIVSALGAIRKPDSNGVRIIHDASQPTGKGLNDYACIFEKQSFQTIDDAAKLMTPNCFMAKIDLKSAYRYVRINDSDFKYTGLKWKFKNHKEYTYMYDTRLPFGSRLAPGIFHRITQSIKRSMKRRGFDIIIVYLDDFLIVAESEYVCQLCLECLLKLLRELGWAIAWDKVVGPTKIITFLGILLDSTKMCLELPAPKLQKFHDLVVESLGKRRLSLKQLQQLAGKLNWASQVVRGGRTYLRRILDVMQTLKCAHHKALISSEMKADLMWWDKFLKVFNGKSLVLHAAVPIHTVVSDACNIAAGVAYNGDWAYFNWHLDLPQAVALHINYKETIAVILSAIRWAPFWANSHVEVLSDNTTAKAIINKGTCKNPVVMKLVRHLFWLSAIYNFKITVKHIAGVDNNLADAISRLHEDGQILRLVSLLRPSNYQGQCDLQAYFHATIAGNLFLSPQIQKWQTLKKSWMRK